MIYQLCKKTIENGNYTKNGMLTKLNVYLKTERITQEQYNELVELMN